METTIFDTLMWAYAKFYNPSEHVVLDKVTVKFKGTVHSQVKKCFASKFMAPVDESGYTYDMRSYWGKDSCFAIDSMQLLDI